jgi:D-glycero-D-manno-heptose 1,7-bisphosphate phosphatase
MGEASRKAIFLDRDGTLLVELGYINHPSLVRPYYFTVEALRAARESGFLLIVVTNQSGVARGYITESDLAAIHGRIQDVLGSAGVPLDAIYYCPHHPRGNLQPYRTVCDCRKPGTALGLAAARRFGVDLSRSYMIGDKETDMRFGMNLGVTSCLVRTGYGSFEEHVLKAEDRKAVRVFDHVLAAVDWIVSGV